MEKYSLFLRAWSEYSNRMDGQLTEKKVIEYAIAVLNEATVPHEQKENVLSNLIYMNPDHAEWYYRMAQTIHPQKDKQIIMWLKLAYTKKPDYYENLYALCKSLFINKQHKSLVDLNVNHIFEPYFEKNIEFLYYYYESKLALNLHKDCDKYSVLLDKYFKNAHITGEDKVHKWINFTNSAKLHYVFGNIATSISYMEKAVTYAMENNFPKEKIISSNQQKISLYDYVYYDPIDHYKKFIEMNDYVERGIIPLPKRTTPSSTPRIKVGYVTSDLNFHAVCNFIHPILKYHDTTLFDIYVFANQENIHPMFLKYSIINIVTMDDAAVAKMIHRMEIDILIDLNGHTNMNRLGIFPYKPSPIQMTYLGYPNTTGLTSIQYRITDYIADPLESTQKYSETLLRMPRCFLLYQSIYQKEPITPRKTNKSSIILGSLNKEPKNTSKTLHVWGKIMKENPSTKLVIKLEAHDNVDARLKYYMKHLSLSDKNRLVLIPRVDDAQYNRLFSMIDIVLDTFPYSGTTTTCNALYNSLPVITLTNPTYHVHNVSASILTNASLSELVAKSEEEYCSIAHKLITTVSEIDAYKNTIHQKFINSMQAEPFMQAYEAILKSVYDQSKSESKTDTPWNI